MKRPRRSPCTNRGSSILWTTTAFRHWKSRACRSIPGIKPFLNVKLRRAFAQAIDRSVFPKILQGGEQPATSWIPPGMMAHNPSIGLAFNPQEARRLLAEAGYPDGKGLPPITLGYNTEED